MKPRVWEASNTQQGFEGDLFRGTPGWHQGPEVLRQTPRTRCGWRGFVVRWSFGRKEERSYSRSEKHWAWIWVLPVGASRHSEIRAHCCLLPDKAHVFARAWELPSCLDVRSACGLVAREPRPLAAWPVVRSPVFQCLSGTKELPGKSVTLPGLQPSPLWLVRVWECEAPSTFVVIFLAAVWSSPNFPSCGYCCTTGCSNPRKPDVHILLRNVTNTQDIQGWAEVG